MSGPSPKHQVTVTSGPPPKHQNPARSKAAEQNPAPAASDRHEGDSEPFTRTETVSIRLTGLKLRPFFVLVSIHTPGAILIEFVEISIYEEDEAVCDIPISTSSVRLNKLGDSQVFRLTDRQLATISEHLEHGNTVKVKVRYLAAERSELTISIIDRECHYKLGWFLAIVGLGFAAQSILRRSPGRSSAPTA